MSLYFVRHQHPAESCPATNPQMGARLLQHLNKFSARAYGVELHSEAVLDGQHTLVLILSAPERENVEKFMEPFQAAGSIEITPASPCEVVVERATC